jgi:hypothetical protein
VHSSRQGGVREDDVVAEFGRRFVDQDWPADRPLPEVFYDPRSLSPDPV